jgi:uncharacterized Zn-finger protein
MCYDRFADGACVWLAQSTHSLKHSNLKPFVCNVCGFATKRKEHLTRHMQRHEPSDGPRR